LECGWGIWTKPNKDVYAGGFKNGKEHGYGVRNYGDGIRKYEGGIRAGLPEGFGVGNFSEGRRIEGGWKEGKPHGWGIETVGELKHEGNFSRGYWEGLGVQTYKGEVTKGEWLKGQLVIKPKDVGQTVRVADQTGKSLSI
jgi:hypothetical protein